MNWAFVDVDGSIQEFGNLPICWKNVSNLHVLEPDKELLKTMGWHVLIDQTVPLRSDLYEFHGPVEYTIDHQNGVVYKNCPILEKADLPQPAQLFSDARNNLMLALRNRRNSLLRDSDWTQASDLQTLKSAEWIVAWKTYRQELRDLPQTYLSSPFDQLTDANHIVWPAMPEG